MTQPGFHDGLFALAQTALVLDWPTLTRRHRIARGVDGDAVHPRIKRAVPTEGRQSTVSLDERFLCNVFGFRRITQQSSHQFYDLVLISKHQQVERTSLAPLRPPGKGPA